MRLKFCLKNMLWGVWLLHPSSLQAALQTEDTTLHLPEVVITASRNECQMNRTANRIQILTPLLLHNTPGQTVDELLSMISGVNTTRSLGITEMQCQVGIRGFSGNEQGRTLVLWDGVPINNSDEGAVNWNSIPMQQIERIEVMKGPASSLYGNSALGGVIHLISKQPKNTFDLETSVSSGSFNTWKGRVALSGRPSKAYSWLFSAYYQRSDGYNPLAKHLRSDPDYSVARFVREGGGYGKFFFAPKPLFQLELSVDLYRDKRGEGEKIRAEDGMFRRFDHNRFQGRFFGGKNSFSYQLATYFQRQNYFKLDERLKGEEYQRFDVKSHRSDWGILGQLRLTGRWSDLLVGGELKNGSVDGGDYYVTSSDRVLNQGTMTFTACFVQGEVSLWERRLCLQLGLRYDHAFFHRGRFETLGEQVADWADYNGDLPSNRWEQISPKVALMVRPFQNISFYLSYAQGFRAPVLDDLCRSGWMWVGPKVANPELQPERVKQLEWGGTWFIASRLSLAPSLYYARGDDFLYYVATGERILGKRDVFRRENVSEVELKGVEVDLDYQPVAALKFHVNYTYSLPEIRRFKEQPELNGKRLSYAPKIQWKGYLLWTGGIVDVMLRGAYKSEQYATEDNQIALPDFTVWDLRFSRWVYQNRFCILAEVLNLFDHRYLDTREYESAGRWINLKLSLHLNGG